MEIALSALAGELTNRSISFLLEKFSNQAQAPAPALTVEESLRRKLLRVRVVVEEAEGRQITSQAMLEQLRILQDVLHRGNYVLDTKKKADGEVSRSFVLSNFNPTKRVQLSGGTSSQGDKEMQQMIRRVEIIITDASEFVAFIRGCPSLYRQPYSSHLLLERCMFGRHVEMEYIISFLLQTGSSWTADVDVLPIFGPAKSGKSTIIEHACNDERVRGAFSRIVLLAEDARKHDRLAAVRDGAIVKHENHALGKDRVLIIIEPDGDFDERSWRRLYAACKINYGDGGGKIIISSRSDKIAGFGTARALKVQYLTREAYWYFFKTLAFGSTDPEEQPKLARIAMEIAADLDGSFIFGNIIASMLRANLGAKFWLMALSCVRECRRRHPFIFGGHPVSPWQRISEARVRRVNGRCEYCTISNGYQVVSVSDEAPMITMQEVLAGSTVPDGEFQVLAWRSPIPPHYSYIFSCEVLESQCMVVRKKPCQKKRR